MKYTSQQVVNTLFERDRIFYLQDIKHASKQEEKTSKIENDSLFTKNYIHWLENFADITLHKPSLYLGSFMHPKKLNPFTFSYSSIYPPKGFEYLSLILNPRFNLFITFRFVGLKLHHSIMITIQEHFFTLGEVEFRC